MSLTTLAFRSLRARPARVALSTLGVALGVAVLFAGLATNAGVEASVQGTVRDLVGSADLRVAAFGETGLSAETVAAIAGTPGRRGRGTRPRTTHLPRPGAGRRRGAAAPGHRPRHRPDGRRPPPHVVPRRGLGPDRSDGTQRADHGAPCRAGRADGRLPDLDGGRR